MKTHAWQRTVGALLFLPLLCLISLHYGFDVKFIMSFIVYLLIATTITSGYHRYFSHNSYECNKFWQFIYGFIGTASLNSSPVEWASVHIAHHKYSDTLADPYDSTWRQFTKFKDRNNIQAPRFILRLLKDSLHRFWVKHSATVAFITSLTLLAIDTDLFIFAYVLPVTGYLFTSYLHNIFAHISHKPRNLPILEFIIPMCGEWMHKQHHENPRLNLFSHFDIGGYFIWVIRNDKQ